MRPDAALKVLHPDGPSLPGAPGLWLDCSDSDMSRKDMRLVVRVKDTSPTLWQYMGQYDVEPSDPLSLQEWIMQSEQVQSSCHFLVRFNVGAF